MAPRPLYSLSRCVNKYRIALRNDVTQKQQRPNFRTFPDGRRGRQCAKAKVSSGEKVAGFRRKCGCHRAQAVTGLPARNAEYAVAERLSRRRSARLQLSDQSNSWPGSKATSTTPQSRTIRALTPNATDLVIGNVTGDANKSQLTASVVKVGLNFLFH
jgi:hypothetical protein